MSFRPRFPLLLASLVLWSSALCAQSQSTPLGDVPRTTKAKKKAAKVYTNDEIPSRPSEPPAPPAAVTDSKTPAAVAGASATSPDAGKQPPADTNLQELKAREAKLMKDRDEVQNKLQAESEPLRKESLAEMLAVVNSDLQNVQSQIAQRSKAGAASKPSGASEPGPPAPAVPPK